MNELKNQKSEKLMTTKEVAEKLKCATNTLRENAKKCLPDKIFENGKTTFWNNKEITIVLEFMKNNQTKNADLKENLSKTSTALTPAFRVQQAMLMMKEAMEEEIANLKAQNIEVVEENGILKLENNSLKIALDESKEWYSIKRMEKLNPTRSFNWRLLKKESENMKKEIKKTFDQNYGEVNSYHISVWESLYFDTLNYE